MLRQGYHHVFSDVRVERHFVQKEHEGLVFILHQGQRLPYCTQIVWTCFDRNDHKIGEFDGRSDNVVRLWRCVNQDVIVPLPFKDAQCGP